MTDVRMPDGKVVRFPDTMPREQIKALIQSKYPDTAAPTAAAVTTAPDRGMLDAGLRGAADTLSFGFDDELAAGLRTGFGFLGDYGKDVASTRERKAAAQEQHPIAFTAGQVGGALPTMLVPGAGVVRGANLAVKIGKGILSGAAAGGLYGAGSGEGGLQNRVRSAGEGALAGAATGAVLPLAGKAIGSMVGAKAGRAAVPDVAALKSSSQALYKAADNQGLLIEPKAFDAAVNRIVFDAQAKGIDKTIHTKAMAALTRLQEAKGVANNLQDVETLRRVVGEAGKSIDPSERYMAGRIREGLDDFMSNLKPSDVIAGDPKAAVGMIKEARKLWSLKAKGDLLADLYQRAELSPSGLENGLRTEFRNLAKNAKKMRGFSPSEQKEIRRIATGGSLQTLLRTVGKAAPTGIVSGSGATGSGALLGALFGGPGGAAIGAAAVPALGAAGRKIATLAKKAQFNRLDATVRNAGVKPFDPAAALLADQRAQLLLGSGGRGALLPAILGMPSR